MPRNKPPQATDPSWQVILEEMRSLHRATIEAVGASRVALELRIDRLEQDMRVRDERLLLAVRGLHQG